MKKLTFIFALAATLFLGMNVKAQTAATPAAPATTATPDYFPGKWNEVVMGTPNGDAKMTFVLQRTDGKLTGAVQDTTGKEISKISQVDEKDKTITVSFSAQGYDLTLTMEPVDDDHVKGSLMGMFDAKGVRVKDSK